MTVIDELITDVRTSDEARDWPRFHSPRNLATALVKEAAELVELFQWDTTPSTPDVSLSHARAACVESELADVFMYVLRLARALDVDLPATVRLKLKEIDVRYPAGRTHRPDPATGRMRVL